MTNMTEKLFKQFHSRMAKEGWLKSLLWGMIVGFLSLFVSAFVLWLTNPDLFWIAFIVLGVAFGAATPIFYYAKFRPTMKDVARRIDDLGLEERMLTMLQYESDDSFMAAKQREDAKVSLSTVGAKMIGFALSLPMIIMIPVSVVLGSGMTTVTALSKAGILPNGSTIIEEILPDEPPVYVSVSYLIEGGGYIDGGKPEQMVLHVDSEGEAEEKRTETVTVVAEDGWVFLGWTDGGTEPTRNDGDLSADLEVTAILMELVEIPGMGIGQGKPGEGMPSDGPPGRSEENSTNPGNSANLGSGHYDAASNQIIDGSTYFRTSEVYEQCAAEAKQILENQGVLSNGEELPDSLKQLLDTYYKIIE